MASQQTLTNHTTPVSSTLTGATFQTAEGNEFSNTGRDTIKITVQNFNIDRAVAPSEHISGGSAVEDNKEPRLVSSGDFGFYSVISTALAVIFGFRRIQPPFVIGEPTCSDDSNLLPPDALLDPALDHGLEPAAIISEITAHDSLPSRSSPNVITERYTRSMLDCQYLAGYPLYEPRPDCDPSAEYWKKGVRIGDVGIVTEDGIFDFLFNVCPSQNPLINPSELPDDFEALGSPEIRALEQHFEVHTHLFNKMIKIEEPDVRYRCLGPEGAILELPAGATLFEAKDKLLFKDLASRHAEKWYNYTIVNRHRDTPNGSLYLVTSCIKCTHWGIAVFDRPSASQDYLKFIENEVHTTPDRDLRSKYRWKGLGAFITKVTKTSDIPNSRDGDSPNQCVFLRGYKIMLRKDVWDNAVDPRPSGASSITMSSSSHNSGNKQTRQGDSGKQNDYLCRWDGGSSGSIGQVSKQERRKIQEEQRHKEIERMFASMGLGLDTTTFPAHLSFEGPGEEGEEEDSDESDTSLAAPSQIGMERVIIQADFNVSPLHPSDLINATLLSQKPDAKVALTHDDDWLDLLQNHEDLEKIASSYTSMIDEYGSASLELITDSTPHGGEKVASRLAPSTSDADPTLHDDGRVISPDPPGTGQPQLAPSTSLTESTLDGGGKVAALDSFSTAPFDKIMNVSDHDDILSWTSQDPRESQLFNSWSVIYRFETIVNANGASTTILWRSIRPNREDRVAKFEWSSNGGLGRIIIGKRVAPMSDLVRMDPTIQGARVFDGPDGNTYRWRPSTINSDIVLQDSNGNVIAFFRPTKRTRYQIGDVYGELHFLRNAGAGNVMHPPMMNIVTITAMLYRIVLMWAL